MDEDGTSDGSLQADVIASWTSKKKLIRQKWVFVFDSNMQTNEVLLKQAMYGRRPVDMRYLPSVVARHLRLSKRRVKQLPVVERYQSIEHFIEQGGLFNTALPFTITVPANRLQRSYARALREEARKALDVSK